MKFYTHPRNAPLFIFLLLFAACANPEQNTANNTTVPERQNVITVGETQDIPTLAAAIERVNISEGSEYTIYITRSETLPPVILQAAGTAASSSVIQNAALTRAAASAGKTITIESKDGAARTIRLAAAGALFTIEKGVTLALGKGITLKGRIDNTAPLVIAEGNLIMEDGAALKDNVNTQPGGERDAALRLTGNAFLGGNSYIAGGVYSKGQLTFSGSAAVINGEVYLSRGKQIFVEGELTPADNTAAGNPARAAAVNTLDEQIVAGTTANAARYFTLRQRDEITFEISTDGAQGGSRSGTTATAGADSTKIDFEFSAPVAGITANDVFIIGPVEVEKGAMSGDGINWTLPITKIEEGGDFTVFINHDDIALEMMEITLNAKLRIVKLAVNGSRNQTPSTELHVYFNNPLDLFDISATVTYPGETSAGTLTVDSVTGKKAVYPLREGTAAGRFRIGSIYGRGGGPNGGTPYNLAAFSETFIEIFNKLEVPVFSQVTVSSITAMSAIAYGNGKFVFGGATGKLFWMSVDDLDTVNAVATTPFGTAQINNVKFIGPAGGKKFFAVGREGKVAWSANGSTWNAADVRDLRAIGFNYVWSIAYGGPPGEEKYIAAGTASSGPGKLAVSTDGSLWQDVPHGVFQGAINGIEWSPEAGIFVAAGAGGQRAWSPDGSVWTLVDDPFFSTAISALDYKKGRFYAMAAATMLESTDGLTWETTTINGISPITSVACGEYYRILGARTVATGAYFPAAGAGFALSFDGLGMWFAWKATDDGGNWANTNPYIAYGGGYFVAVLGAANGKVSYWRETVLHTGE